jgi:hypothetical protein
MRATRAAEIVRIASRIWLAMRVGVWLCALPVRWHLRGVTELLRELGPPRPTASIRSFDLSSAVRIVQRVSRLRLFRLPLFPRACLREALGLYHVLTRAGYPVQFCIGVRKSGENLVAHSWVALHGTPIPRHDEDRSFTLVYRYPDTGQVGS